MDGSGGEGITLGDDPAPTAAVFSVSTDASATPPIVRKPLPRRRLAIKQATAGISGRRRRYDDPMDAADLAVQQLRDEDAGFLQTLGSITNVSMLQPIAAEWKTQPGAWAAAQKRAYFRQPLARPGHQTVVKQLFKQAEDDDDRALLADCLVAFDRLVRYERTKWGELRLDSAQQPVRLKSWQKDGDTYHQAQFRRGEWFDSASEGTWEYVPSPNLPGPLFGSPTGQYLRRRAWRSFRRLGFQQPAAYVDAIVPALAAYRDADLQQGEDVLESWGLMHICFGQSDALWKSQRHIRLKRGAELSTLAPAPDFEPLWQTPAAGESLLRLVERAEASLVRTWSRQMLDRHHGGLLEALPTSRLVGLLDHADPLIVTWASELLERSQSLDELAVDDWVALLRTSNPDLLFRLVRLAGEQVDAAAVPTEACVQLAMRPESPAAELGLRWLDARPDDETADRETLSQLARSTCEATGTDIADWVLARAGTRSAYDREVCTDLLDSPNESIRREAWDWLTEPTSPGREDAALWTRLLETPHEDRRLPLIRTLREWARPLEWSTAEQTDALTPVWASVLAGVHRGSREKLLAIDQLGAAIVRQPSRADSLLPVLRLAVRSVRGPEHAAALAAVVQLVEQRPSLTDAVEALLPELELTTS